MFWNSRLIGINSLVSIHDNVAQLPQRQLWKVQASALCNNEGVIGFRIVAMGVLWQEYFDAQSEAFTVWNWLERKPSRLS